MQYAAEVMQNETDRQGVDGVSWGLGGGRVYIVRNVDVDTQQWTGRVMLGNTLGGNLFTSHHL